MNLGTVYRRLHVYLVKLVNDMEFSGEGCP